MQSSLRLVDRKARGPIPLRPPRYRIQGTTDPRGTSFGVVPYNPRQDSPRAPPEFFGFSLRVNPGFVLDSVLALQNLGNLTKGRLRAWEFERTNHSVDAGVILPAPPLAGDRDGQAIAHREITQWTPRSPTEFHAPADAARSICSANSCARVRYSRARLLGSTSNLAISVAGLPHHINALSFDGLEQRGIRRIPGLCRGVDQRRQRIPVPVPNLASGFRKGR